MSAVGLGAVVFVALLSVVTADGVRSAAAVVEGRTVSYLTVPLDRVRVRVALGQDRAGRTESLAAIATRYRAIAAINGGYFEAYATGPIKNLVHTIAIDGTILFKGDVGDELYFDQENHALIEHVPLRIEGALDGSFAYPNNWYAYWLNRMPGPSGDTITIFTPAWGAETGMSGFQVQVDRGVVTAVGTSSTRIPPNGYVVYIRGEERVASHFRVGRKAEYRIVRTDRPDSSDAFSPWEAIGCGPRLLTDGLVTVDPLGEHFTDPKVWIDTQRSMAGVTRDGRELILAVSSGTLEGVARIMLRLGAYQAMNLDDAASSGLWFRGTYPRVPGRALNNVLLILP
jgi:hypothetical protein